MSSDRKSAPLQRFLASDVERRAIASAFVSHDVTLDFLGPLSGELERLPNDSGVYFIHGRRGDQLLKVYVGKATDVRRRIGDYHRAFQVHCPNDRKLAIFQEWLGETDPGWSLSVSTLAVPPERRSAVESEWIHLLGPLVNATRQDDREERAVVERAFRQLFRSYFEGKAAGS